MKNIKMPRVKGSNVSNALGGRQSRERVSRKMLSLSEGNTMKLREGQGRGVTLELACLSSGPSPLATSQLSGPGQSHLRASASRVQCSAGILQLGQ